MYRHHVLISVFGFNKIEASNKVLDLLNCYKKKRIFIVAVVGANNRYEVEVEYLDGYEQSVYFPSEDFEYEQNVDKKILKHEI